jgi:ribonuclease P protein component
LFVAGRGQLHSWSPGPPAELSRLGAFLEEIMGEANLSAQEAQEDAHTRVSGPDVDTGWSSGAQGAAAQRPPQAERLIWRIRDRATFEALTSTRRRRRGPISMTFLPGDPSLPPRVAYAVGKPVGPAVVRNRVRRRLRAATRAHRAELRPGGAYLFGASPAAASTPFAEIEAAMGQLLAGAGRS